MSLPVFIPGLHHQHSPEWDYSDGIPPVKHPEQAGRVDALLESIITLDEITLHDVTRLAEAEARKLHDEDYVDFLMALEASLEPGKEYYPTMFGEDLSSAPLRFQGGGFCRELGTPILKGSIQAALNSAAAAIDGARSLLSNNPLALALCRPPGHHAGKRRYGGYCYLNNAYLATNALLQTGKRCAVLDIDYHIGDGSMEFASAQAPYFSLHADPWVNYPYLDKNALDQRPHVKLINLEGGEGLEEYMSRLKPLLDSLYILVPDYLVISLGLDTFSGDPVQDAKINLQIKDYEVIAQHIRKVADCPTLILLEGGYDQQKMDQCLMSFLRGYLG